jgi:hypothetical protein
MADLTPEVAAAFEAEAAQLDLMAETLETINRMSPSPSGEGEIRAYRAVARRLRNKAIAALNAVQEVRR